MDRACGQREGWTAGSPGLCDVPEFCYKVPRACKTAFWVLGQFVNLQLYMKKFVQDWPLGMTGR